MRIIIYPPNSSDASLQNVVLLYCLGDRGVCDRLGGLHTVTYYYVEITHSIRSIQQFFTLFSYYLSRAPPPEKKMIRASAQNGIGIIRKSSTVATHVIINIARFKCIYIRPVFGLGRIITSFDIQSCIGTTCCLKRIMWVSEEGV